MNAFDSAKNRPGVVSEVAIAVIEVNMQGPSSRRYLEGHKDQKLFPQCPNIEGVSFTPIAIQENGGMKNRAFILKRLNYIKMRLRNF